MQNKFVGIITLAAVSSLSVLVACSDSETTPGPDETSSTDAAVDHSSVLGDGSLPSDAAPTDASSDSDAAEDAAISECDGATNACVVSAWSHCSSSAMVSEPCALGCAANGCNTTCEAAAVVIEQSTADDFVLMDPWQSFQVASTGVLTALEVRANIYSANGDPRSLTLSIYVGEGVGGTRIAQQSFNVASASGAPFTTFTFTTPVPLQAAQKYTWQLTGAGGIYYSSTDTYANGRASVATRDMVFKAHAQACN